MYGSGRDKFHRSRSPASGARLEAAAAALPQLSWKKKVTVPEPVFPVLRCTAAIDAS